MEYLISWKNNSFGYNSVNAFNNFNLNISKGEIVTLVGSSGSGKTTLLKMLCHKIPNDSLYFNGEMFGKIDKAVLKKSVVVIFDEPFRCTTVKDELKYFISKTNIDSHEISKRVDMMLEAFNLDKDIKLDEQDYFSQSLIKILRYLIIEPEFLAIDNQLAKLKSEDKTKIINFVKEKNITLFNVTTSLNESLFGERLLVLENFVIIMEGATMTVLKADTLLKRIGFKLPLAADLSLELIHYDVLDKIYLDEKKLVMNLWK